ncbi:hypothetical protein AB7952_00925 [Streptomyces sp. PG2]
MTTSETASGVPWKRAITVALRICWAMTAPKTTNAAMSRDVAVASDRPGRRSSSAAWEPRTVARHGLLALIGALGAAGAPGPRGPSGVRELSGVRGVLIGASP